MIPRAVLEHASLAIRNGWFRSTKVGSATVDVLTAQSPVSRSCKAAGLMLSHMRDPLCARARIHACDSSAPRGSRVCGGVPPARYHGTASTSNLRAQGAA